MATSDDRTALERHLPEFVRAPEEPRDVPTSVTVALGVVAAVLVATSTYAAAATGHATLGLSFLAASVLLVGTVLAFEAGRYLGHR